MTGDLLQGTGTKWQSVPCFRRDTNPSGPRAACELKGKAGATGCRARAVLGGNL